MRHDPCNLHHPPPYLSRRMPQARLHPLLPVPLVNQSRLLVALGVLGRSVGASLLRSEIRGVGARLEVRALVARSVLQDQVGVCSDNQQPSSSRTLLEAIIVSLGSHRVQGLAVSQIPVVSLIPLSLSLSATPLVTTTGPTAGSSNPPYQEVQERDPTGATPTTLHYQAITCMPAYRSVSFEVRNLHLLLQNLLKQCLCRNCVSKIISKVVRPPTLLVTLHLPHSGSRLHSNNRARESSDSPPPAARSDSLASQLQAVLVHLDNLSNSRRHSVPLDSLNNLLPVALVPSVSNHKTSSSLRVVLERSPNRINSSHNSQPLVLVHLDSRTNRTRDLAHSVRPSSLMFRSLTSLIFPIAQPQANSTPFSAFASGGTNAPAAGASPFNQPQQNQSPFGAFGQQNSQANQQQGGNPLLKPSVFSQSNTGGGLFGNTGQQQQSGGIFGNTQQQQGGGLFSSSSTGGMFRL